MGAHLSDARWNRDRLLSASFLAMIALGAACGGSQPQRDPVDPCFGGDLKVTVTPGRIGSIPLDAPIDSVRKICRAARDTTANVYEALDSAIVIGNAQFSVVGTTAVIGDEEGVRHERRAKNRVAFGWIVRGGGGVLPGGVSTAATWQELHRAYGRALLQTETSRVVVEFCGMPGLSFTMAAPLDVAKNQTVIDDDIALPADSRIVQIDVSKTSQKLSSSCPSPKP